MGPKLDGPIPLRFNGATFGLVGCKFMAKKQKNNQISVSFHLLVKQLPNEEDPRHPVEVPFSQQDFSRLLARLRDDEQINVRDPEVIKRIKLGIDLPFSNFQEPDIGLYFGNFEGAYYGQKYRNNVHGEISAESLNLRSFCYLVTFLRDGTILLGVTYNGQFGDYEGIRRCFSHILRGNHVVSSRTIRSLATELGAGDPIAIKVTYRRAGGRPERRSLFGRTGDIAIRNAEFGEGFGEYVRDIANRARGDVEARRRVIADILNDSEMIQVDDNEVVGCTAIVRENKRTRTVYILGENNFATKFPLDVNVNADGVPDYDQVRTQVTHVMRQYVIPLLN